MWLLSFEILAVISHEHPDGHKLLITTDHRRDPELARTAPLTLPDHSEPMHRTDTETRTIRIVPGSDETHRNATDPSTPDPCHLSGDGDYADYTGHARTVLFSREATTD